MLVFEGEIGVRAEKPLWTRKEPTSNSTHLWCRFSLGPSNISVRRVVFFLLPLAPYLEKDPDFCKRQRSKAICESKLSWVNLSFWPDLNFWYINVWFSGYCRPTSEAQDSKVWSLWGRYEKRESWTQCVSVFHLQMLNTEFNLSMSECQTHWKSVLLTLGAPRDFKLRGIRTFQPWLFWLFNS